MHVLSTPPAFVLSQDQTLYKWYLNDRSHSNLHRAICHSFISVLQLLLSGELTHSLLAHNFMISSEISFESYPSGAFFSLRCLIYKVHAVSRRNIAIIQNFISFVKNFFQKFFDGRSVSYRSNFLSLTRHPYFVKYFFQSFLTKFFSCARFRHLSADSFVRIPPRFPFVNAFFQVFSLFPIVTITPAYFGNTSVQNSRFML